METVDLSVLGLTCCSVLKTLLLSRATSEDSDCSLMALEGHLLKCNMRLKGIISCIGKSPSRHENQPKYVAECLQPILISSAWWFCCVTRAREQARPLWSCSKSAAAELFTLTFREQSVHAKNVHTRFSFFYLCHVIFCSFFCVFVVLISKIVFGVSLFKAFYWVLFILNLMEWNTVPLHVKKAL